MTTITKTLIKQAEKCTVRECDEVEKAKYVAYIDEGNDTYDVSLSLSKKGEPESFTCDCKSSHSDVCRHAAALILHVGKGAKTPVATTAKFPKNKPDKISPLLEAADASELKEWVKELLLKNKDLELAFTQRFSLKKTEYSPQDVAQITIDAVKAVVKNKINLDTSELKKIIDLWTDLHAPVVQVYLSNVINENAFFAYHAILESCLLFSSKINVHSNRISKYLESMLNQSVETIATLHEEETWHTATQYFFQYIPNGQYKVRLYYVVHLKNIAAISSPQRKINLVHRLAKQYSTVFNEHLFDSSSYTKIIMALVEEVGLFNEYHNSLKPIHYDNDFNLRLINLLIENNHPVLAEKYCNEQIAKNYKDVYSVPYLKILKEIYSKQNNEEKLMDITAQLLPHYFDFDDYLVLYERMPEGEEKIKWRNKIIARARTAISNYSTSAQNFYFKLMDHEKKYKKMIESIDSKIPLPLILQYYQPMALTDQARLLKAIVDKSDDWDWGIRHEEKEKEKECFPELFALMTKTYTERYLELVVRSKMNNRSFYRYNQFVEYMAEQFKKGN